MKKNIISFALALLILTPAFAITSNVNAAPIEPWGTDSETGGEGGIQDTIGLGNKDPRTIAASVINVVLGFLGIVAVVIILLGGFKWMTAAGNEDKVEEAKKLISAGIIGLVIILAAFGIASYVIKSLMGVTGANS